MINHDNYDGPCSCGAWHEPEEFQHFINNSKHEQDVVLHAPNEEKELKWHKFYMDMAKQFATMSKDPRLKVGCVIVTPEGILFPGINGWEKGGTNEPDSLEPGMSNAVHSECNAIIRFSTLYKNSKLYCTDSPCAQCARMIVNTQAISEVYYQREYRITKGLDILRNSGIAVYKID